MGVRSQERLEGYRARSLWQTKWERLQAVLPDPAGNVFVSGAENLRQLKAQLSGEDRLGAMLAYTPNPDHFGVLLGQGTPIALWVRKQDDSVDWRQQLTGQVFCCCAPGCVSDEDASDGDALVARCCLNDQASASPAPSRSGCRSIPLAALSQQVTTVRQGAPDLEDAGNLNQSFELGHHLSFLWEDPNRVPPEITYS